MKETTEHKHPSLVHRLPRSRKQQMGPLRANGVPKEFSYGFNKIEAQAN
jgi:hypothetical protein